MRASIPFSPPVLLYTRNRLPRTVKTTATTTRTIFGSCASRPRHLEMFGDDSHFEYNTLEQKEPFARGAVPRWRRRLECDWTLNKFKRSTGAFNLRRSLGRRVSGKKDNKLDVIVHEWLSRPHDERLTTNQAVLFAEKAKSRYDFHDHQVIFNQLSKHVGKSY